MYSTMSPRQHLHIGDLQMFGLFFHTTELEKNLQIFTGTQGNKVNSPQSKLTAFFKISIVRDFITCILSM